MKLPFWMYPRHWGLQGSQKEIALIDFNYTGVEAKLKKVPHIALTAQESDEMINQIKYENNLIDEYAYDIEVLNIKHKYNIINDAELHEQLLKVQFKHHRITERDFDTKMVELVEDDTERLRMALGVNLKYHEITQNEYDKEISEIDKVPWSSLNVSYDKDEHAIDVQLDYNKYFIQHLRDTGHPGISDDEVIDFYINDCGRKLSSSDELHDVIDDPEPDNNTPTDIPGITVYK